MAESRFGEERGRGLGRGLPGLQVGGASVNFDAPQKAGSGCFRPRVGGMDG